MNCIINAEGADQTAGLKLTFEIYSDMCGILL